MATLHLDLTARGRSCTVGLTGVLDVATAHRLTALGTAGALGGARFVTLDLAGVGHVDVAGWHALRDVTNALSERGVTVTQIGSTPAYDRLDAVLLDLDACRRRPGRFGCVAA